MRLPHGQHFFKVGSFALRVTFSLSYDPLNLRECYYPWNLAHSCPSHSHFGQTLHTGNGTVPIQSSQADTDQAPYRRMGQETL